ncbi:M48 family metalloprotease [Lentilactobacillus sp. Marseille-Q4993]|uniref:M48 family metalloprotease n=1 Tax=Lentilactobacillus sp. Marseille-Q4993 TaxID=3039492 RepID=UPI0024BC5B20|nr:M48 family metalloprotease [Lentilactobacillus sp. Marseille-Q4993]
MLKRLMVTTFAFLVGLLGVFLIEHSGNAMLVKFDKAMIVSKNLSYNGKIKYYVDSSAKSMDSDIEFAVKKWNGALGKRMFVQTNFKNDSRLVITKTNRISGNAAGMTEVNSGVIALQSTWMNRYNSSKRRAVMIHELGHTFGTKDLYLYPVQWMREM